MGMGGNAASALKKIDAADGKGDKKAEKEIEKLFAKFDKDKSGQLEGAEFQNLLNEMTKYVHKQMEALAPGDQYEEEAIRGWIQQWMDPSKDGKCSLAEMKAGIAVVLNADEA
eukprot:NODE_1559_length_523_cov_1203.012658_g1482_i0.p1 GENE.NODE_1559_length_523_cov_1203.012658_g1482_i0~~NODE_1559_length_523_cov_1203.012658_g1482_i0.p1  ORF type:complete len:113 (-),score=35.83 NODE_1559_length_523_cov_1203.012658_g1482_i0:154-492(-)